MNNFNKNINKKKTYRKSFVDRDRADIRNKNKRHKKHTKNLVRRELYPLIGRTIPISAVLSKHHIESTMISKKPIIVTDCIVNKKIHVDHLWIFITDSDRHKLRVAPDNTRAYFTAVLHEYTSRNSHESGKVGVSTIHLITGALNGSND